jgi:predicted permease
MWEAVVRFVRKLRFLGSRARFRSELAEEIALHEELKLRELSAAGYPPDIAKELMRREMGNSVLAAEESEEIHTFVFMEHLMKDLKFAFRLYAKQPAFTLTVILSLALGIAGNTAVFSTVSALLLKPLPYRDPGRLVRITSVYPKALLVYFQKQCRTMDVASVSPGIESSITGEGPAFRASASATSAQLFSLLGASPHMGRVFDAGEDQPGRDRLAILSYDLWTSRFGADPNIVGRVIRVNEIDRRIVGVMPAGFAFPSTRVQLWFPAALDPRNTDAYWAGEFVPLIGRLRPGMTITQAKNEIRSLAAGVWSMFPFPMPPHWNAESTVIPLQTDLAGDARGRVLMLWCAVGAVLIIACANAGALLMARAITRRKEIALRAALGAGQSRIVRQLLVESVLLAMVSGGLGLALGGLALQLFRTVVPTDLPASASIQIDWRVAAFTAALALLSGLSFGIAPALAVSRMRLVETVKSGGQRGAGGRWIGFRNWLVGGEIALTLMLVIGAGLLIRTLYALSKANLGFDSQHVMAVKISPDVSFCAQPDVCISFYRRLLEGVRGVPGVLDAAIANTIPLDGSVPALPMDVEGHPRTASYPSPMFWTGAISPGYLRLMGIPLLAGRAFAATDSRLSEPVVLISASTANHFWPGESAIGKHIKVVFEQRWRTVVGVVADIRQYNLQNRNPSWIAGALYMPYAQSVQGDRLIPSVMHVIVKTGSQAPRAADQLYDQAVSGSPNIPVSKVVQLRQLADDSVSNFRSTAWLFLAFAGVAVFLATIGVYALVSYSVSQRAYEISIRVAIGATNTGIVRMILARSLRIAAFGTLAGLSGALFATRGLSALLYEVPPTDLLIYASVSGFLLIVTALASLLPAWRATHIDPVQTLRAE